MNSPIEAARVVLDEFESSLGEKPLAHKLSEGLEILDEIRNSTTNAGEREVAVNIANTYINKAVNFAVSSLEKGSLSELELERLNDFLIEIKESAFGNKDEVEVIRNRVIAGLIKHYFQGYTKSEQEKIIETITSIET